MNWHIGPITSALLRNRTGALLVAIQIALALAVLVNAVYVVEQRVETIGRPTGLDEENIFAILITGFSNEFNYEATLKEDLAWLRGLPGVVAAAPSNAVPLSGGGSSTTLYLRPDEEKTSQLANYFEMDEHGLAALGVKLSAGRTFTAEEILPPPGNATPRIPQILVSEALAKAFFPDEPAVGKTVYGALGRPTTIIGVIEHMHGSWVHWATVDRVLFIPQLPNGPGRYYIVRTRPGERDAIMRAAEEYLSASNPTRVVNWVRPLTEFKARSYRGDRNMAIFLISVTAMLLAITALGIFGLATFNVSTRTRQIGTRRAVGARRRDIVRHFLTENWILTTAGVVVGCALALAIGNWLSAELELDRLDLYYLVAGVLALWGLGLLAAWHPARRAARISPAVATRTI